MTVPIGVEDVETSFVVDTGSAVNIVSADFASKLKSAKAVRSHLFIKGIGGDLVSPVGETLISLQFGGATIEETFLVLSDCQYKILGGLPFCQKAQLLIRFPSKET